jgi:hypothetical protein
LAEIEYNVVPDPMTVSALAIVTGVNVSLEFSSENVIAFVLPYSPMVMVGLTAATVYNENDVV